MYSIIGIMGSLILSIFGAIRMELIKKIVSKVVHDNQKVTLVSILLLISVSVIPAVWGINKTTEVVNSKPSTTSKFSNNTELETSINLITENASELISDYNEIKAKKEIDFKTHLKPRWVYQLGEFSDNELSLEKQYFKLKYTENVSVFNVNKNKLFLFVNINDSHESLEQNRDSIENHYGTALEIIDLSKFCTVKKPDIKQTEELKFGKRKKRVELSCFKAD